MPATTDTGSRTRTGRTRGTRSRHNFRGNMLPAALTVSPVAIWFGLLILVPMIYVIVISFCSLDSNYNIVFRFTLDNYKRLADLDYLQIYGNSLLIALTSTVICLLLAYPFAYLIARMRGRAKIALYMLVIVPFWTNSLIRIYGWRTMLGAQGLFNKLLMGAGIVDKPVEFLFTRGAVILGMVYALFPFMVLPLYTALEKLDGSLLEAAKDLGARSLKTLFTVTIPLTATGIFSGCIMVFIPTLGYFFVSDVLGGGNSSMIGNVIESQFRRGNNWPLGAALSVILILITLVLVKLYQRAGGDMESLGG
ncbi:MAG: ABC transporter permease [Actinomycetes bacterium]|jgi:spermidine/putrescine transport system permease protein|nr:ABC transporter permease [Actinomycetes bacterium]